MNATDLVVSGIVHLIDEDTTLCRAIQASLQPAGLAVHTYTCVEAFTSVSLCAQCQGHPCCLLVELELPGQGCLELLERRFCGRAPCPIITMSARGSVRAVVRAMQLGAVDFLEKPFAMETLRALVIKALSNHPCAGAKAAPRRTMRRGIARLSQREREVFERIIMGYPTKMIASHLNMSCRSVDYHRAGLMEKLDAANVADLVRMALDAGYQNVPR